MLKRVKTSLKYDYRLLREHHWSVFKKIRFILKKYVSIANSGRKNHVKLFGKKVYFDKRIGIGDYHKMLVTDYNLVRRLRDMNTILDIGANVGYFTLMAKDLFPHATITAFEPIPKTFELLKANISPYSGVHPEALAISQKNGTVAMAFDAKDSTVSKISDKGVRVRTETLDSYVKRKKIDTVDILKIDVETFEKELLKGAQKTLAKTRYILMEIMIEDNERYSFTELCGMLHSKHYNYQLLDLLPSRRNNRIAYIYVLFVNTAMQ